MTDEDALLKAIIAAPFEDTPRLALADWYEENDNPDRAEYIRGSIRLVHVENATCDAESDRECPYCEDALRCPETNAIECRRCDGTGVIHDVCGRCNEYERLTKRLTQLLKVEWFGFDPDHWQAIRWQVIRSTDLIFNLARGFPDKLALPDRLGPSPRCPDVVHKLPLTYIEYNHEPYGTVGRDDWRWYSDERGRPVERNPVQASARRAVRTAFLPDWAFGSVARFYPRSAKIRKTLALAPSPRMPGAATTRTVSYSVCEFDDRMKAIEALSFGVLNTYREMADLPLLEVPT